MLRPLTLAFLFTFIVSVAAFSQALPRKAFHGATLRPDSGGLRVGKPAPEGTLAAAGLQEGDRILTINGKPVGSLEALAALGLTEGQKIAYGYQRGGKPATAKATVKGRPLETWAKGEMQYVTVPFGQNRLRGMVNKPAGPGPFPTVLFIQGYTCSPICDAPDWHPYRRIAEGLAERGYAVLRVEKPGIGESAGPTRCEDMDLLTEADAFEAGLNWLEAQPYAAKGKSYIYGHSLGGIVAPMLAQKRSLAGVVVYGTTQVPWYEYFFQMLRTQGPNMGQDYLENEQAMRRYHRLLYQLLVERKTPQEAIAQDTSFHSILINDFQYDGGRRLLGRDISTYWDLNRVNLTEAWAKTSCPVLSCYGSADIEVMTADGPKTIADIVNRYHPGNGSFRLLEGMNHSYAQVGSMETEYKSQEYATKIKNLQTAFDPRAITLFTDWAEGLKK